ncbi:hypothetical protein A2U01_0048382 [Trifolium medium]|uniref:Uncharacterized protein n=1 Tax=Trifolium medium TaxID=97028 RepID=A0A392QTL3_9FABA|nr:hypothetical protein [Trifolium medium]
MQSPFLNHVSPRERQIASCVAFADVMLIKEGHAAYTRADITLCGKQNRATMQSAQGREKNRQSGREFAQKS